MNIVNKLAHSALGYFNFFTKYGTAGNKVALDASSLCQLQCHLCPQATGHLGIVGRGYLRFKNFKKFVDRYPGVRKIELSNWGEIFLNPELEDIIKYAHQKHVYLTAYNGVNFNHVDKRMLLVLVQYQFQGLFISIDGVSNTVYTQYRKGGNIDKVFANIDSINYYKQLFRSRYPALTWQFVIFGHNEHELPLVRRKAKELGMRFFPKFNWDNSYSPIRDNEFVRKEMGACTEREYRKSRGHYPLNYCQQLWNEPHINWDGKLLGCCVNTTVDFGNVFESGLEACLKSERYTYAKKMILGLEKARGDIPCSRCLRYNP